MGESVIEQKNKQLNLNYSSESVKENKNTYSSGESMFEKKQNNSSESSYEAKGAKEEPKYKNTQEIKKLYYFLKASITERKDRLEDLVNENEQMPNTFKEAKILLEKNISNVKEEINQLNKKLLLLTLENPDLFNVNVKDIDVYER